MMKKFRYGHLNKNIMNICGLYYNSIGRRCCVYSQTSTIHVSNDRPSAGPNYVPPKGPNEVLRQVQTAVLAFFFFFFFFSGPFHKQSLNNYERLQVAFYVNLPKLHPVLCPAAPAQRRGRREDCPTLLSVRRRAFR